jgi:hypothetical protein
MRWGVAWCSLFLLVNPATAFAADPVSSSVITSANSGNPTIHIPHIEHAVKLDDFEGFQPISPVAKSMVKIDQFVVREPVYGTKPTQPTEVYMGFTDQNLYMVFLAHDADPKHLRSHMSRREDVDDDDQIGFFFDTFSDQQNAYLFYLNPKGVQQDGTAALGQNFSLAWDGIWNDSAKVTPEGYMVLVEIPFKSLRFPSNGNNTWRFVLHRAAARASENSYFPAYPNGKSYPPFQDMALLDGFDGVHPGHNLQIIPYINARSFMTLDSRDLNNLYFTGKTIEPRVGLDAKAVLRDSLVLDATINPDFAQVESDQPQITVNQRFETFFPEKRPFFIENAGYFQTPLNLVFTRRIADPLYGARASGKIGKWSIGALYANDRSPGQVVPDSDPLDGQSATFGVLRVNRSLGGDNSLGMIYTDRELNTPFGTVCDDTFCNARMNRVGGVDGHFRFSPSVDTSLQFVHSRSEYNDGSSYKGHDYYGSVQRRTPKWYMKTSFKDVSPDFETLTGFFERPDVRDWQSTVQYTKYMRGGVLQSHGPFLNTDAIWDHNGVRLDYLAHLGYNFNFTRQTFFTPFAEIEHERLRPSDFSGLVTNRDYPHHRYGVQWFSRYFRFLNINGQASTGEATNYSSPDNIPRLSDAQNLQFQAIIRAGKGITVENTYLWSRLHDQQVNLTAFNDHIFRQKWNLQFTKEMSLRFITQYESTLANPTLANLPLRKNLNFDVLFTYMWHPGTALYVGYNSNLQNLDRALYYDNNVGDYRRSQQFLNDGRQVFVKFSYVFRY